MLSRVPGRRSRYASSTRDSWFRAFSTSTRNSVLVSESTKEDSEPCSVKGKKWGRVWEGLDAIKNENTRSLYRAKRAALLVRNSPDSHRSLLPASTKYKHQ